MAMVTSWLEGLFTSLYHNKATVKFQNNILKLGLKLPRVSAILLKSQNGGSAKILNINKV